MSSLAKEQFLYDHFQGLESDEKDPTLDLSSEVLLSSHPDSPLPYSYRSPTSQLHTSFRSSPKFGFPLSSLLRRCLVVASFILAFSLMYVIFIQSGLPSSDYSGSSDGKWQAGSNLGYVDSTDVSSSHQVDTSTPPSCLSVGWFSYIPLKNPKIQFDDAKIEPSYDSLEMHAHIDKVQKKIAKIVYGDIVIHETEEEKLDKTSTSLPYLWSELYRYAHHALNSDDAEGANLASEKYDNATRLLRTYTLLYTILVDRPNLHAELMHLPDFHISVWLISGLERKFFPWLSLGKYPSLTDMRRTWKGRGIVLTVGKNQYKYAVHSLIALRTVIKTKLPIEIFYAGFSDLDEEMARNLTKFSDVKVYDLLTFFEAGSAAIETWHTKPYAILASSFEEVVLVDADSLFFQDPGIVFDFKGYKDTGTAFFFDRTLEPGIKSTHQWLESWLVDPTPIARRNRFWNHLTYHEAESGVVVFDKQKALMQLMGACWFNTKHHRPSSLILTHGDKETFWIINEGLRLPYYFVQNFGGAVGFKRADGKICGGLFHLDENRQPFWWNSGVLINKHFHDDRYITFTYWATDYKGQNTHWITETPDEPFCFQPSDHLSIGELTDEQKTTAAKFVDIFKQVQIYGVKDNDWDKIWHQYGI